MGRSVASLRVAVMIVSVASPAFTEVTFEWFSVGNPGNAADPLNSGSIPGIGSVADVYRIARHEVTNDQYAEFLNAVAATDTNGLYNASMSDARGGITQSGSSGSFTYAVKANMGNKPVNYVSFFDALRFVRRLPWSLSIDRRSHPASRHAHADFIQTRRRVTRFRCGPSARYPRLLRAVY